MSSKYNNILNNLGKADVTSHVNFSLLKEFFLKNNFELCYNLPIFVMFEAI